MALDTCNVHRGVKSTGHCYVCHKPICPQCPARDGCCSAGCFDKKQRFGPAIPKPVTRPWWPAVVQFAVLAAIAYFVAKKMGWIP